MKILVMCEGPNEKAVVNMLLDAGCLEFSEDELVGLTVYHARQLTAPVIKTALSIYTGEFAVYRIGDSMTDKLPVPADYQGRIMGVRKFCTKPELEMLLIIAEGKESEFGKVKAGKHRMKPKDFCKANVVYNRKRYDNSTQFYRDYFGADIETLVRVIKKYKQTHGAHKKDEEYLADLLKLEKEAAYWL